MVGRWIKNWRIRSSVIRSRVVTCDLNIIFCMSEFKRLKTNKTKCVFKMSWIIVRVICECVVNLMRLLCVWDCECILAVNYFSCQLGQLVQPPSSPRPPASLTPPPRRPFPPPRHSLLLLTTPFPLLHISVCLGGGQVPYNTRTHKIVGHNAS